MSTYVIIFFQEKYLKLPYLHPYSVKCDAKVCSSQECVCHTRVLCRLCEVFMCDVLEHIVMTSVEHIVLHQLNT